MIETLKKIQELIEQNKILEQRNEELKNIVSINLSKQDSELYVPIAELIGITEIENLVLKFYQNYKIPVTLYDNHSEILFSIGWKRLFTNNIGLNKTNLTDLELLESIIHNGQDRKYFGQKSLLGFNTIAFPIEIHKEHKAVLVFNQFLYRDEIPEYELIRSITQKYNLNEDDFLDILTEIPVFSHGDLDKIIKEGIILSEMISFVGSKNYEFYKRFKQQVDKDLILNSLNKKIVEQEETIKSLLRSITEHQKEVTLNTISRGFYQKESDKLIQKLERSETILNAILTSSPMGICLIKEGVITFANDQMYGLTGYTIKELLGRPISFLINESEIWEKIKGITSKSIFRENITFNTHIKTKEGKKFDIIGFLAQIKALQPKDGYMLSLINSNHLKSLSEDVSFKTEIQKESIQSDVIPFNWSDKTILIAEDEEFNYIYLKKLLSPTKINIKWAINGQKAVDYFTEDPKINLILMDIKMPVLNGIDATRIIKSIKKSIPVIAQTAYSYDNTREASLKAGCDEYLTKPIITTNFFSLLDKFLNQPPN